LVSLCHPKSRLARQPGPSYRKPVKKALSGIYNKEEEMEDLIKALSEVGEESPAFEGLMVLNSDSRCGSLEEDELDLPWEN
jgi:hypothetical protein